MAVRNLEIFLISHLRPTKGAQDASRAGHRAGASVISSDSGSWDMSTREKVPRFPCVKNRPSPSPSSRVASVAKSSRKAAEKAYL